jgi:acyl carrier protein
LSETLTKIADVIADLFDDHADAVTRETSAADIEDWDSLANIQLVVMVERQFGIQFATSEIQGFRNVGDLVDAVDRKRTA